MKYSTWNKWDLHIHTRASNYKFSNEYFGEGCVFTPQECKAFRDAVMKQGITFVAITDHNYFNAEQFKRIKSLFRENKGNALPGVELKVFYYLNPETKEVEYPLGKETELLEKSQELHCVIIFNDDCIMESEFYMNIQEVLEALYVDIDSVYIGDVLDAFLHNKYEFILIPHFSKHSDLDKAIKDKPSSNMELKNKWLVGGFFSGLDGNVSRIKRTQIGAINYLKNMYEFDLPAIQTSDNHDYRNYSGDVSEYKALPTFNGLKLCFSDFDQRVKYQKDEIRKNDVISKIIISPESDNKLSQAEMELSPYLNCIIGGRSSGKSLLIALIGNAVGDRTNNHIDQTQKSLYEKFIKRYEKYLNKTNVKLLREDGTEYDGRIDIYLQDSIIQRFEGNHSSLLFNDFKEEFNERDVDDIEKIKDRFIKKAKSFIDLMDKLNTDTKTLKSRGNIISSIRLPDINNDLIFYTDKANNKSEILKNELKDYQGLHDALEKISNEYSDIIKNSNHISEAFNKLVEIVNIEQKQSQTVFDQFEWLLSIIKAIKSEFEGKYDEAQKQFNTNRQGILGLVNDITNYISTSNQLTKVVTDIQSIEKMEKYSENTVGNYKFIVKYSSTITPSIFLGILNDFRIQANQANSLQALIHDYINEDKKWSHGRKSEAIKPNLEAQISQYIKKEYQIYEGNDLINEMSEGRKASVFLDILLNKELNQFPIIIDQPEDNMDNNDISNKLVASIRTTKNKRQIFVITHNPNVLVNGDAENVIVADKNQENVINYLNSAIEYNDLTFDMIQTICQLVEGGTNAFLQREKKYGLEVTDGKNYKGDKND